MAAAAANGILIIAQAQSYRITSYLLAAQHMGLKVVLATNGEHSLISEISSGLILDLDDQETALQLLLKETQTLHVQGVLGCDDSTVELAAQLAQHLKLPHNPVAAARLSRRKDLARAHLQASGCPVPKHQLINLKGFLENPSLQLQYPCVIKPVNLSASKGVIRADNEVELLQACRRIYNILSEQDNSVNVSTSIDNTSFENEKKFSASHALIEEYIDGIEVAFEGYLQEGQLFSIALFDKPDPLEGPHFEETIYVTPSQLDRKLQDLIEKRVAQACAAYGLKVGPVHAELRIDSRDAWILEIASRTIGGDCARMLDMGGHFSLEELSLSLMTGRSVQLPAPKNSRGVMMIPIPKKGILQRIEGLAKAREIQFIDQIDIIIAQGHKLIPLPEGNQYLGYIFASAENANDVVDAIRKAHAQLKFVISPVWDITPEHS